MPSSRETCIEAGCSARRIRFGRCHLHGQSLPTAEKNRLRKMRNSERVHEYEQFAATSHATTTPHWTYEGREDELIAALEKKNAY
jgi:hypothetical protein